MNQYYCPSCNHKIHQGDRTVVDGNAIYHCRCFYNMEENQYEETDNSDTRNEHGFPVPSPNKV